MDIFIAWSGKASNMLATALHRWLPDVIPTAKPFMSEESIRKGQRWLSEIGSKLENTNFGILCVTPENLQSPWMHFEAGAVAKSTKESSVSALLLDVAQADLDLPLSQFQHTQVTKEEVSKLVLDLNTAAGEGRRLDERVKAAFQKFWPDLQEGINQARALLSNSTNPMPKKRSEREILERILDVQLGIQARLGRVDRELVRQRHLAMRGLLREPKDLAAWMQELLHSDGPSSPASPPPSPAEREAWQRALEAGLKGFEHTAGPQPQQREQKG